MASPDGRQNSVTIHQDALLFASVLKGNTEVSHDLQKGRGAWLQMIHGEIKANGKVLKAGDGAALETEATVQIKNVKDSEFLLFDLGL